MRALPAIPGLFSAACLIAAVTAAPAEAQVARPEPEYTGSDRIEEWSGRRILVVTPHPDDETFTSGGTLAILAAKGNDIRVVVYTTDNAGSRDPEMTKDRLKAIRRAEEEEACRILGIPKENIVWLGHDDGMLEYVDRRDLTRQVAREIRRFKPNALFSVDPGSPYEQYHKSDHRSGAIITVDAIRAARVAAVLPGAGGRGLRGLERAAGVLLLQRQPELHSRHHGGGGEEGTGVGGPYQPVRFHGRPLRPGRRGRAEQAHGRHGCWRAPSARDGRVLERFRRSTAY